MAALGLLVVDLRTQSLKHADLLSQACAFMSVSCCDEARGLATNIFLGQIAKSFSLSKLEMKEQNVVVFF